MATTTTSRGSSWSDNEVRALICIWGEDNIREELDGAVKNQVMILQQRCVRKDTREIGNSAEQKLKILRKNTDRQRITMGKLEEGGKCANFIEN